MQVTSKTTLGYLMEEENLIDINLFMAYLMKEEDGD